MVPLLCMMVYNYCMKSVYVDFGEFMRGIYGKIICLPTQSHNMLKCNDSSQYSNTISKCISELVSISGI